jgi:hypothetical protein
MGYTALRRVSNALRWAYDSDPLPDGPLQLTAAEFARAVELLYEVGFATERDADAARPHFRGWRVNYEDLAYRWANGVLAPPAPWSGTRAGLRLQNVTPRRPPAPHGRSHHVSPPGLRGVARYDRMAAAPP